MEKKEKKQGMGGQEEEPNCKPAAEIKAAPLLNNHLIWGVLPLKSLSPTVPYT